MKSAVLLLLLAIVLASAAVVLAKELHSHQGAVALADLGSVSIPLKQISSFYVSILDATVCSFLHCNAEF